MIHWFKGFTRLGKIIIACAVAVALVAAFFGVRSIMRGDAPVRARLATEQADAALESGRDAVETVGANNEAENETDEKVEGIEHEVDQAIDGDGADRAGRNGLCQQFNLGCEE